VLHTGGADRRAEYAAAFFLPDSGAPPMPSPSFFLNQAAAMPSPSFFLNQAAPMPSPSFLNRADAPLPCNYLRIAKNRLFLYK
jgi:hypothetical protein